VGEVADLDYSWIRPEICGTERGELPLQVQSGFRLAAVEADFDSDTPEQQKAFAENPELFLKYSKMIESELNVRFKFILNGTEEAEGAREVN
jgi:hypothetical protein